MRDLSSDRTLRMKFESTALEKFWISVAEEYPGLSKTAKNVLTRFGSTNLCEVTFSALTYIKRKSTDRDFVSRLISRVAVSSIARRLETLYSKKQAHPSY